ncbi:hypothetical protein BSKO_06923 [Bryopsis sp. KO-2023]|nr:hypothetical protein BSKO_06923 [Bryopsis sp. KO-2023]
MTFLFLSNKELLDILTKIEQIHGVQSHPKKIFEAIDSLAFVDDEQLLAMHLAMEYQQVGAVKAFNLNQAVNTDALPTNCLSIATPSNEKPSIPLVRGKSWVDTMYGGWDGAGGFESSSNVLGKNVAYPIFNKSLGAEDSSETSNGVATTGVVGVGQSLGDAEKRKLLGEFDPATVRSNEVMELQKANDKRTLLRRSCVTEKILTTREIGGSDEKHAAEFIEASGTETPEVSFSSGPGLTAPPGRWLGLPIFKSVQETKAGTDPDALVVFDPPPFATKAVLEAVEDEIDLIACITEGIPKNGMVRVENAMESPINTKLIGPNCPGTINPGKCEIKLMLGDPSNVDLFKKTSIEMEGVWQIIDKATQAQTKSGSLNQTWSLKIPPSLIRDVLEGMLMWMDQKDSQTMMKFLSSKSRENQIMLKYNARDLRSKAIAYRTQMMSWVNPGKGDKSPLGLPILNIVQKNKAGTSFDVSIVYDSPSFAAKAVLKAVGAEVGLVAYITEGTSQHSMVRVKNAMAGPINTKLMGPNCLGTVKPDECKIRIMPGYIHQPDKIGIVSQSGTLTYEAVFQTANTVLRQSTVAGIDDDPFHGTKFIDALLEKFVKDPQTVGSIMIEDICKSAKKHAAKFIEASGTKKPEVSSSAGLTAPPGLTAPLGRSIDHAGSIIVGGKCGTQDKIEALEAARVAKDIPWQTVKKNPIQIQDCNIVGFLKDCLSFENGSTGANGTIVSKASRQPTMRVTEQQNIEIETDDNLIPNEHSEREKEASVVVDSELNNEGSNSQGQLFDTVKLTASWLLGLLVGMLRLS